MFSCIPSSLRAAIVAIPLSCLLGIGIAFGLPAPDIIRISMDMPWDTPYALHASCALEWPDHTLQLALSPRSGALLPSLSLTAAFKQDRILASAAIAQILTSPRLTFAADVGTDLPLTSFGATLAFPLRGVGTPQIGLRAGTQVASLAVLSEVQFDENGWTSTHIDAQAETAIARLDVDRQWTSNARTYAAYTVDVPMAGLGVTRTIDNTSSGLIVGTSWHAVDAPSQGEAVAVSSTTPELAVRAMPPLVIADTHCGSCSAAAPAADDDVTLRFGEIMVGENVIDGFSIRCTLGAFCWLDSVTDYPRAPFQLGGASFGNTVINGQTARVDLQFSPTSPGEFSDTIDVRWCYAYWVDWEEPLTFTVSEMEGYYTARCITLRLPMAGTALAKPEAHFTYSPDGPICGKEITFDGSSSFDPNPDGEIVSYSWTFDGEPSAGGRQMTHRFSSAGTHQATLTVTNNRGMTSDPTTENIEVKPDLLEAAAVVGAAATVGWVSQAMALAAPALAAAVPGVALAVSSLIAEAGLASYPIDQLVIRFPESWTEEDLRQLVLLHIPTARVIGSFSTLHALLFQFPISSESPEDAQQEMDAFNATLAAILPPGTQLGRNYIGQFEGTSQSAMSTIYDIDHLEPEFRVAYDAIRAPKAWDDMQSCGLKLSPVRVAIVDTGIDASHEEFILPLRGKSYVADADGEQPWYQDPDGHGSQVSGIIGSQNGRGRVNGLLTGCAGAYEMQIYRVRGDMFSVWDGARLAASRTVEELDNWSDAMSLGGNRKSVVLNISLGWDLESLPAQERILARNTFLDLFGSYPETLFVSSAGNGDNPKDLEASSGRELVYGVNIHAPGGLTAPNHLTVAATNTAGTELMPWSNYGSAVDIAAPGYEIFTSDTDQDYTWRIAGTSYAAAMVSGVAAAVLAVDPRLTPEEVKHLLTSSPSRVRAPDGSLIPVLDFEDAVDKAVESRRARVHRAWWWAGGIAAGIVGAGFLLFRPF